MLLELIKLNNMMRSNPVRFGLLGPKVSCAASR